jgi:hypothetical protein
VAKPTSEQQAARDKESAKTLLHLAKQGNAKAKEAITVKGGKKS